MEYVLQSVQAALNGAPRPLRRRATAPRASSPETSSQPAAGSGTAAGVRLYESTPVAWLKLKRPTPPPAPTSLSIALVDAASVDVPTVPPPIRFTSSSVEPAVVPPAQPLMLKLPLATPGLVVPNAQ